MMFLPKKGCYGMIVKVNKFEKSNYSDKGGTGYAVVSEM